MSYSSENGYVPMEIEAIMLQLMNRINTQFSKSFTWEAFQATNFYKYYYGLAQEMQANEIKTSEIFLKLLQYFQITNERISRPVTTSPGIIEKLEAEDFIASLKPPSLEDAGTISLCVDLNDGVKASGTVEITSYANLVSGDDDTITVGATVFTAQAGAATPGDATFQAATANADTAESLALQINSHATAGALVRANVLGAIVTIQARVGGVSGNDIALAYADNDTNVGAVLAGLDDGKLSGGVNEATFAARKATLFELISRICVAGCPTIGIISENIVLSNGQSFPFKFNLPWKLQAWLRLTITTSVNNQVLIGDPDDTKQLLLDNIDARYRLGRNFEPQKYFSVLDAPWSSQVQLEYSLDYNSEAPESATWSSDIYTTNYDDLFDLSLSRLILVEE